jgi:hypothetical protein
MLSDETLRQLIRDRRSERERQAEAERLAVRAQTVQTPPSERPALVVMFGHYLAARRHALP